MQRRNDGGEAALGCFFIFGWLFYQLFKGLGRAFRDPILDRLRKLNHPTQIIGIVKHTKVLCPECDKWWYTTDKIETPCVICERKLSVKDNAFNAEHQSYEHKHHIILAPSPKTKWNPQKASQFINALSEAQSNRTTLSLMYSIRNNRIFCVIKTRSLETRDKVLSAIQTFYPDAQPIVQEWIFEPPIYYMQELQCVKPFLMPIKSSEEFTTLDPAAAIVSISNQLEGDELVRFSIRLWSPYPEFFDDHIADDLDHHFGRLSEQEDREFSKKIEYEGTLLQPQIRLQLVVDTKKRAQELCKIFNSSMAVFKNEFGNALTPVTDKTFSPVFHTGEIAALWHPPSEYLKNSPIVWAKPTVKAPASFSKEEGVLLGDNEWHGQFSPIYLPDIDRVTHMNIVGKTGAGKSTFMHNLIHQDIANGRGVAVIDPHGELVRNILRVSIPEERYQDVVILNVANLRYPPPINPLVLPKEGIERAAAASQITAILDKVGDSKMTSRVADTVANVLSTITLEDNPNVRDVSRLFSDVAYRYSLIKQVDDPVLEDFWHDFEALSPRMQQDLSYPVLHRMRQFYRNPILYHILCHPQPLDFAQLMSEKKIILISLGVDESLVPERERNFLGAVLLTQLEIAHYKAAKQQEEDKLEYYLYIDEVQNFTNASNSLEKILSEARKYGLRLIMANQYLGQIKGDLLDSVMGNIGATMAFQMGTIDAKVLAPYMMPSFTADNIVKLDQFTAAAKLRYKTKDTPAFSINTRMSPGDTTTATAKETEQKIREQSIQRYLPKERAEIQAWLKERYARKDRKPNPVEPDDIDDWKTKD